MQNYIHSLKKERKLRFCFSICTIVLSAFLQCYILNVFMDPCNLISGGFTGLALLIHKICALVHINFPVPTCWWINGWNRLYCPICFQSYSSGDLGLRLFL